MNFTKTSYVEPQVLGVFSLQLINLLVSVSGSASVEDWEEGEEL